MAAEKNNNNIPIPTDTPKKYTKKRLLQFQMLDSGCNPVDVLKISNNKATVSPQAVHDIRHQYKKWLLTKPAMVKQAHNVIKDVLNGAEHRYDAQHVSAKGDVVDYQEVTVPTWGNRMAAAAMVYDRIDPIRGSQDAGQGQQPHPVNLALFINVAGQPVDNSIITITENKT